MPSHRNLPLALTLALATGFSSCGATRIEDSVWKQRTAEQASEGATHGSGSEAAPDVAQWLADPLLAGTCAKFVIERGPAGEPNDRWDVRITAPTAATLGVTQNYWVNLTLSMEDGTEVKRVASTKASSGTMTVSKNDGEAEISTPGFPLAIMRLGFMKSCALGLAPPPDIEEMTELQRVEAALEYIEYMNPLLSMVQLADKNKAIRRLMLDTVQFPSWWSLLTFSVDIEPDVSIMEAEAIETAYGPGYRVPFHLKINGDPALYATMTVVAPTGALQLTAGIIAIDGFAPDRPDDLFTLRFVGAENDVPLDEAIPIQPTLHRE